MATVSNKSLNTASMTNKSLPSHGLTWDEATFDWDHASDTWDNPYSIANKSLNTGSVTNKSLS